MPVANIIETQENVENSGSESSGPSLMLPYREIARYAEKITNDALVRTKSQPNESVIQVRILVVPVLIASGSTTPEIRKAIESAAATPNTTLSTGSLPSGSRPDVGLVRRGRSCRSPPVRCGRWRPAPPRIGRRRPQ